MELCETRKIDELGRILIPEVLLEWLNVAEGDDVDIHYADGQTLVIKVAEPKCVICKSVRKDGDVSIKGSVVCRSCLKATINAQEI